MEERIEFYHQNGKYGCFSNFSSHPVKMKKYIYPTSEHYFQAMKFTHSPYHFHLVRKASSPMQAKILGGRRDFPLRKDWEDVKEDIMYHACYTKFSQNSEIQEILFSTGDKLLVEHTKNDRYWGDGGNGKGKNRLGKILMEVRHDLLEEINL